MPHGRQFQGPGQCQCHDKFPDLGRFAYSVGRDVSVLRGSVGVGRWWIRAPPSLSVLIAGHDLIDIFPERARTKPNLKNAGINQNFLYLHMK